MTPLTIHVRSTGDTYYARHGIGKDAVTATCTSSPEGAAKAVAVKVWKLDSTLRHVHARVERIKNPDPVGLMAGAIYTVSACPEIPTNSVQGDPLRKRIEELEQQLAIARDELKTSVSSEVIGARLRDYQYEKTRAERAEAALEAKTKELKHAIVERYDAVIDAQDHARIALACANREAKLKTQLQDTQGNLLFAVHTLRRIAATSGEDRAVTLAEAVELANEALVQLCGGAK